MRSRLLVALQFALIAALAAPWVAPVFHPAATISGAAAIAAGVAVGLWALFENRPGNFNVRPEPRPGGRLVTTGPYRFVRHPMYAAVMLFALGCAIGYGEPWRVALLVALAVVLHVKAGIEEGLLAAAHPAYADYARRTPRLIPFLR